MNYLREINAFYDWLETNSISDSAVVLWHALMHTNSKAGWIPEFAVAISTLETKTGLKKAAIIRARQRLQIAGRIDFKSRSGQQSAIYRIMPFEFQNETQSNSVPKRDTKCNSNRTLTETLSGTLTDPQSDPIIKLNKTKQNKRNDDNDTAHLVQAFEQFFQRFPNEVQRSDMFEYLDKGMHVDLMILALKKTARNNKPFGYALTIIKDWFVNGILSVAQYEALEAERQSAAGNVRYMRPQQTVDKPQNKQDERYSSFYELFPDA